MTYEQSDGSVLVQVPSQVPALDDDFRKVDDLFVQQLPLSPEDEALIESLPPIGDSFTAFKPFAHKNSSIPLVKRHLAQLLVKKLPSRSHPVFDRPPDTTAGAGALQPPPVTQDTNALARSDPGFSVSSPVPDPDLLLDSNLNRVNFALRHFDSCQECRCHGREAALNLPRDENSFCVSIFNHFHPECYAQHLFRGLFFGYQPALENDIAEFSVANYKSLFDPAQRASLEKAWGKQLKVNGLFGPGDERWVSPLTLATRFIDKWEAELTGTPVKGRVCFDASRGINANLAPWRFRYADFPYILKHVNKKDYIAQLDLRGWYLQLGVRRAFQKFLSLRCPLSGRLLKYRRLPFGLSTAPGYASLVTSELVKYLNAAGFKVFFTSYIDDVTIIGASKDEVAAALRYALEMLSQFGIDVAPEKICEPSQVATVLGIIIDTRTGCLRVRPEHLDWTLLVVKSVLKRRRLTKRKLQSLAGMLNWISPLLKGSRPYMRALWDLYKATKKSISAPKSLLSDLRWWRSALYRLKNRSCSMPWLDWATRPKVTMLSDASGDVGCGVWLGNQFFCHTWTQDQLPNSVPWKELYPIIRVLERFGPQLAGSILLTATDSATNSFSINKGSSRAIGCNALLKRLSALERRHDIDVIAIWCPREFNSVTDFLSKNGLPGIPL